jgi:hypothetical protein
MKPDIIFAASYSSHRNEFYMGVGIALITLTQKGVKNAKSKP